MPFQLRVATASDAGPCAALVRRLSPAFLTQPDGAQAELFFASVNEARQAEAIATQRYVVAAHQGQLAGLAALRAPSHLFHLFVDTPWQRQGLGQRLLLAALEGSDARLPLTVNASLAAVPFYRRLGFEPAAAPRTQHGVCFQPMTRPAD